MFACLYASELTTSKKSHNAVTRIASLFRCCSVVLMQIIYNTRARKQVLSLFVFLWFYCCLMQIKCA